MKKKKKKLDALNLKRKQAEHMLAKVLMMLRHGLCIGLSSESHKAINTIDGVDGRTAAFGRVILKEGCLQDQR